MMSENKFWKILDWTRNQIEPEQYDNGDEFQDMQGEYLRDALGKLEPEEIIDFDKRFHELTGRAYRWDIWGAAYWIGGGCSDDGFTDFRGNLVSLGREMYEKVLKNPDNLADIHGRQDVPTMQGEGFAYIAREVYEELTGESMDVEGYPKHPEATGESWDFDDKEQTALHLPRLVKKLPDMGDG
jgi:hypothetical protein